MIDTVALSVIRHRLQDDVITYAPAQGSPRQVTFGASEIADTHLTSYELYLDERKKQFAMRLFAKDSLIAILFLQSSGIWIGRDRTTNGFATIKSEEPSFWKKVFNPITFNKEIAPQELEAGFTYQDVLPPQLSWPSFDIRTSSKGTAMEKVGDTALAVLVCDRPNYFTEVADSMKACPEFSRLPVYVFLDKPEDAKKDFVTEQQLRIIHSRFPSATLIMRPMNYGCGRNLIDARRQLFDNLGYDKVFIFEDDMVIGSSYVQVCLKLLEWAQSKYDNVGVIQAWNPCFAEHKAKMAARGWVIPTIENLWGYLMTKGCWDSIKETLYKYETLFLGGQYKLRPHKSIQKWFHLLESRGKTSFGEKNFPKNAMYEVARKRYFDFIPTTQDGCTNLALWLNGWSRIATYVNRGRYIGKFGIHSTPTVYNQSRFGEVTLDPVLEDMKFVVDPEKYYKLMAAK